jgi:peptidoglycan hydrolase-like protein with peptidoglycan-binding domain
MTTTVNTAAATTNDPTLKKGDQGAKVKELQELLNKRIPKTQTIKADGVFGDKTEIAVKTVQYQFLLKRDGIAGPLTWKSLRANAPVDKPVLKKGSKGEQVSIVQQVLKDGGFYKGAIDGDFGTGTDAAVKAFQKGKNLTVDGIVDVKTWKALSDLATFLTVD